MRHYAHAAESNHPIMAKKAANTGKTTKPRGKGKPWPAGVSGNPKGRPKDGESWAAIIKSVGDMYPADLIAFIGKDNDLGRMLATLPKDVQMKYLVTARVFSALMFEPSSGLWKELMDRVEGKVIAPVDITSNGETVGADGSDTKAEILRKLDSIAAATGAREVPVESETAGT